MSRSKFKFQLSFLFILLSLLLCSCAKIAPPSGGPADTTAPTIISTIPLNEAVNILKDNIITIEFSESIKRESVDGQIFITPRQSDQFKLSWKGSRLQIILPDSFQDNSTYVVNLGTGIRDIRANLMEKSFSFAFSTGAFIDRGEIAGFVSRNDRPSSEVSVGLFLAEDINSVKIDSVFPPYLTLSGKEGEFKLEYLPEGHYLPLAFIDKNRNQLFDYPAEVFGVPDRIVNLRQERDIPEINFNLIQIDTSAAGIITVAQGENNLLRVRITKPFPPDSIASRIDKMILAPVDSGKAEIKAVALKEYGTKNIALFNIYLPNLTEGRYVLKMRADLFDESAKDTAFTTSSEFEIRATEDKTVPRIEFFSHADRNIFPRENKITLHFSEPMIVDKSRENIFYVTDDDGTDIVSEITWPNVFTLCVTPENLDWDKTYYINIDGTGLSDLSGNLLADSILIYAFSVHSKDSLGKISGSVTYGPDVDSSGMPYLEIKDLQGKPVISGMFPNRNFSFDLPPGQYFLSGYLDRNLNGMYDPGSYRPLKLAETFTRNPDTIRVRYRFETAGIELEFK